jgi:hypothetical protein
MKNSPDISLLAGLVLLALFAPAVHALWMDPAEFLYGAIVNPYPGYAMKAEDYARSGDLYNEKCEEFSSTYHERLRTYVQEEAAKQNKPIDMTLLEHPTAAQRAYVMSTGFHQKDTVAAGYYDKMMLACDLAENNYNKALHLTKKDDYKLQAGIFDSGSRVYDALGMTSEAEQTRKAANVARAHAAASDLFLPLPIWAAIAGITGGLFLLSYRKKE